MNFCDQTAVEIHTRQSFRAFTLIELLVVVDVIAVLISLLMPAIRHARQLARVTQCISNHRQIIIARSSYALDYEQQNLSMARTSRSDGAHVYWTFPQPWLIPPGLVLISDILWNGDEALQNGLLHNLGYYSSLEALWCTEPESGRNPLTGEAIGPVLASHPDFGFRSFGVPDHVAGPGVYLTREQYLDGQFYQHGQIPNNLFYEFGERVLTLCPFLARNRETHAGRGVAVGYGNGAAQFLPFGNFIKTNAIWMDYGWLDSKGTNQFIYASLP